MPSIPLIEPTPPAEALLWRHAMLGPPLRQQQADGHHPTGIVWKPRRGPSADDAWLNQRHFAVLGLQTRLRQLLHTSDPVFNLALRLFLSERTDHAYVDPATFQQMAQAAPERLGPPTPGPVVFIDVQRECLVLDASRCFEAHSARLTAAAVRDIVAMSESRRFAACLQARPQWLGDAGQARELRSCVLALQATAGCIARTALHEPGLQLLPLARRLAEQVGPAVVARALLTGDDAPTHATVAAFVRLWRDRQVARRAGVTRMALEQWS